MILDTNAISALWEGHPAIRQYMEGAKAVSIPVPALAEFRFGVLKSRIRDRMEVWLENVISSLSVLDVDASTTRYYANLRAYLETKGHKIPMNDLWISAIALQHGYPILSQDAHFDRVPQIKRLSWKS